MGALVLDGRGAGVRGRVRGQGGDAVLYRDPYLTPCGLALFSFYLRDHVAFRGGNFVEHALEVVGCAAAAGVVVARAHAGGDGGGAAHGPAHYARFNAAVLGGRPVVVDRFSVLVRGRFVVHVRAATDLVSILLMGLSDRRAGEFIPVALIHYNIWEVVDFMRPRFLYVGRLLQRHKRGDHVGGRVVGDGVGEGRGRLLLRGLAVPVGYRLVASSFADLFLIELNLQFLNIFGHKRDGSYVRFGIVYFPHKFRSC